MRTIVVAYDGSQYAKKALETAKTLAEKFGSKVYIIHVVDTAVLSLSEAFSTPNVIESLRQGGEKVLREALTMIPNAEVKLLEGDPAYEIAKFARDVKADLVVVGSRGLSTIRKSLLGSVAGRLVQESDVSILVVK